ncbi:hypothetical protein ABKA04_005253 [Annulohypoxylon sp. FPYF3050]
MSYAMLPESVRDGLYHPLSQYEWAGVISILYASIMHIFVTSLHYFNAVSLGTDKEALDILVSGLLVLGTLMTGLLLTAMTFVFSIGPKRDCRLISGCTVAFIWTIYAMAYTNAIERPTALVYGCLWYWTGFVAEWWLEPVYHFAVYMAMCTR